MPSYRTLNQLRKLPRLRLLSMYRASLERAGKMPQKFTRISSFSIRGWLPALWTYLKYVLSPRVPFPVHTDTFRSIYPLSAGNGEQVASIAMAGDWGTGTAEAAWVTKAMVPDCKTAPDYTIHLGDVYYIGDAPSIDQTCLGVSNPPGNPLEPIEWRRGRRGSFSMNGNHEMYATGKWYFTKLLPRLGAIVAAKPAGQRVSYFCLENDYWRIVALDTGYNSLGIRILNRIRDLVPWPVWLLHHVSWLRPSCQLPKASIEWLRDELRLGQDCKRGLIILTHHQYYSAFEDEYPEPARQLAEFIKRPVLWFWGQEHRMAGYHSQGSEEIQAYGRCIGHGGMPVERKCDPDPNQLVFYDNRLYVNAGAGVGPNDNFGWNGYVTLDFKDERLTVKYLDIAGITGGQDRLLIEEKWTVDNHGGLSVKIRQECEEKDFYGPKNWGGPKMPKTDLVDLHAHYAMHLRLRPDKRSLTRMTSLRRRLGFRKNFKSLLPGLLVFLNNRFNFPTSQEPSITIPNLQAAGVQVLLSMLYEPFDEIDFTKRYAAPPEQAYFNDLLDQMQEVEDDVNSNYSEYAVVVHNASELIAAGIAGKVALIHAIEGGFQLGTHRAQIAANVGKLKKLGVAYVSVAHLFFRKVATNAPAIPFLPDWIYHWWFPMPPEGLTPRGRDAITAMVQNRILIDLTHMSEASIDETLNLLDSIDKEHKVSVLASHSAYRFGEAEYNLIDDHIRRIAERKGVIGLIACNHFMTDGLSRKPKNIDESLDVLCRHIDKIACITKSHDFIGIGSDLDGFIKPTLKGLEYPIGFLAVRTRLTARYSATVANQILSGNALRLLSYCL